MPSLPIPPVPELELSSEVEDKGPTVDGSSVLNVDADESAPDMGESDPVCVADDMPDRVDAVDVGEAGADAGDTGLCAVPAEPADPSPPDIVDAEDLAELIPPVAVLPAAGVSVPIAVPPVVLPMPVEVAGAEEPPIGDAGVLVSPTLELVFVLSVGSKLLHPHSLKTIIILFRHN